MDADASTRNRRPYRVPIGLPGARQRWRGGAILSLLVHVAIVILLVMDFQRGAELRELKQGAGGPGPAGGGGGGNRGTGAQHERLEYVVVAPPPSEVLVPPPPKPVAPEPVPVPQLKFNAPPMEMPKLSAPLPITGIGGGTGSDQTGGTGPGSGGGVGTGVGTGRGSGVGSGTGGGDQENYPPTPIEMFIPPLPVPPAARGAHVIVHFDVDERGRVRGIEFTPTRDRGYNRRLREALDGYRFRPGTTPDGTPIRMTAQITIDLP